MFYLKKYFLFLILSCSVSLTASAQHPEIGAWVGVSNYFGDLNINSSFQSARPGGGVFGRYNFGTRFAFKTGFNYGLVTYDDANTKFQYQQARNLSFKSNILEWTNHIEFNFFRYEQGKWRYNFTPYLLTGISVFAFNPKAYYQGEWVELQPLATEGGKYSRVSVAIPLGGGIKYALNERWSIGAEVASRISFTDHIDDVSDEYVFIRKTGNLDANTARALADRSGEVGEPFGRPGKQRGNVFDKDDFLFGGVWLAYTITWIRCPTPSNIP